MLKFIYINTEVPTRYFNQNNPSLLCVCRCVLQLQQQQHFWPIIFNFNWTKSKCCICCE